MERDRSELMHMGSWVLLFVFTASCTLFFFLDVVPAKLWWLPWVSFVAFEYGLIHWLQYHKNVAKNSDQWYCSLVMVCISVSAVTISTAFELVKWIVNAGVIQLDLWWMKFAIWSVVAVFPANLVALVFCELRSPSHIQKFQTIATRQKEAGSSNGAVHPTQAPLRKG